MNSDSRQHTHLIKYSEHDHRGGCVDHIVDGYERLVVYRLQTVSTCVSSINSTLAYDDVTNMSAYPCIGVGVVMVDCPQCQRNFHNCCVPLAYLHLTLVRCGEIE